MAFLIINGPRLAMAVVYVPIRRFWTMTVARTEAEVAANVIAACAKNWGSKTDRG